eukprot:COSAG01_NODE_1133_length_11566_cov_25.815819_5_plen_89_part_00
MRDGNAWAGPCRKPRWCVSISATLRITTQAVELAVYLALPCAGEELDMSMFDGVDDVAGASAESQSQQLSDLDGESMTTYADGVEEAD